MQPAGNLTSARIRLADQSLGDPASWVVRSSHYPLEVHAPNWLLRSIHRLSSARWFSRVAPSFVPQTDRMLNRLTGGRVMLNQWVVPASISLVTTGARSGKPRTTPLAGVPLAGDHYVVASNFGRTNHPAWSYNLMEHPDASITIKNKTTEVTAHLLDDAEKAAVWPELVMAWPPFDDYVERSGRDQRVFRLVATG